MTQKQKHNKHSYTKKKYFTKTDFNSGDGMLTSVWGPSLWHYLHVMSFNYPVHPTLKDKTNYKNFILSLQNVLPCRYCRTNLTKNFKKCPLTMKQMENRDSFSKYVYNLHQTINKMLHKPTNLTYADVRDRYEHFRSRCTDKEKKEDKDKDNKENKDTKDNKENKDNKLKRYSIKQKQKQKQIINSKTRKEKEKGCTKPLHGKKAKCIIKIVPQDTKGATFQMHKNI